MNSKTDRPFLQCEAVARAGLEKEPARLKGRELLWNCPNHDGLHPSLKINREKNTWLCGPCGKSGNAWELTAFLARVQPCDKPAVTAWLRERGLLGTSSRRAAKDEPQAEKLREHVYVNQHGEPLAKKIRWGSHDPQEDKKLKRFSWQRWEDGKWVNGLDEHKQGALPLYRLDKIKDLPEGVPVILCEGEHDADAGAEIGLAITTSGGTGTFPARHAEWFGGKDIVIVAHADEPGQVEAERRAALLYGKAKTVKVASMRAIDKKDLAEFVEHCLDEQVERDTLRLLLSKLFDDAPEWKPESGANILDAVYHFVQRFVSLRESQARVVTLWVVHTHAIDAAEFTPYLAITSPEKRCGKSRLLEVLRLMVRNPWKSGSGSAAVLARKIDLEMPTLLLDESDATFNGPTEYSELLRGVLNNGFEREGGTYDRMEGQGANQKPRAYRVFCPKAIAGIGKLPDTVADRAIPIRMQRAAQGQVARLRGRDAKLMTAPIATRLAAWCHAHLTELRDNRLPIINELNDRQNDFCEPLLIIADLAGGDWPKAARQAAIELCAQAQGEDDSLSTQLLHDVKTILDADGLDCISSEDLANTLGALEDRPWAEMPRSHKPITKTEIAKLLGRHGIRPGNIRFENGEQKKGYRRDWFLDAWEHYPQPLGFSLPGVPSVDNVGVGGLFESAPPNLPADSSSAPVDFRDGSGEILGRQLGRSADASSLNNNAAWDGGTGE